MPRVLCNLETPGFVREFSGQVIPNGFLACDGSFVSMTTYAALYAAIGSTWGAPVGGTFKLPDTRGRVIIGAGTSYALGINHGSESVQLAGQHLPSHTHTYSSSGQSANHAHAFPVTSDTIGITHYHTLGDSGHRHQQQVAANPGCGGYRYSEFRADSSGHVYPQNHTTNWGGAGVGYTGYAYMYHTHGMYSYGASNDHTHTMPASTNGKLTSNNADLSATPSAHQNVQPCLVLRHIIKY